MSDEKAFSGSILRVFEARAKPGCADLLVKKFATTSGDVVRNQPGNLGHFFGKSVSDEDDVFLFVSVWRDLNAVKSRFGDDWKSSSPARVFRTHRRMFRQTLRTEDGLGIRVNSHAAYLGSVPMLKALCVAAPPSDARNVRFGSLADICSAKGHVRFGPKADMNQNGDPPGRRMAGAGTAACRVQRSTGEAAARRCAITRLTASSGRQD